MSTNGMQLLTFRLRERERVRETKEKTCLQMRDWQQVSTMEIVYVLFAAWFFFIYRSDWKKWHRKRVKHKRMFRWWGQAIMPFVGFECVRFFVTAAASAVTLYAAKRCKFWYLFVYVCAVKSIWYQQQQFYIFLNRAVKKRFVVVYNENRKTDR